MNPDNDTIILLIEVGTGIMMFLSIAVIATVVIINHKKLKDDNIRRRITSLSNRVLRQ